MKKENMKNDNPITLKHPIKINGTSVTELTHDTEAISVELYQEASDKAGNTSAARCLYLGMAAVIAANPNYSWEDVARIAGSDIIKLSNVGANFIIGSEEPQDETSEEQ